MTDDFTDDGWEALPEELRTSTFMQVIRELNIVKDHPRPLVLVAHGFIEMAVDAVIENHLKNSKKILSDSRGYSHSIKLVILNEVQLLDDEMYKELDAFRKLRNKAAHDPLFKIEASDLVKFKREQHYKPEERFLTFCLGMIGGFWNRHLEVLMPEYLRVVDFGVSRGLDHSDEKNEK